MALADKGCGRYYKDRLNTTGKDKPWRETFTNVLPGHNTSKDTDANNKMVICPKC